MAVSLHETCEQYVARRLSEGWRIIRQKGFEVILQSPEGIIRPVDLRNDIETLRPNAAGDETSLYASSGEGDNYAMVDEVDPDDTSTYVRNHIGSSDVYQRDLYNLPASSGSGTINFIKIYIRAYRYTAGDYVKPSLKSNSTVTDGTEIELTGGWENHSQQWDTNPADSAAWEWADIDALQIGVSLKSSNASASYKCAKCTQVYVEVDYTAGATEKTSSDAGSGVDALYSLEKGEVKTSSDAGSGVEGTPVQSATLAGSETGSGIEALIARLLVAVDTGYGVEAGDVEVEGLLKDLFASELGRGSDSLAVKIEMPTKGGGMKLWM